MIIRSYANVLLVITTCISCFMCQILNLNTSSAIRRYRRVLLPAPHPLRAPSRSFGQPSLSPAPGEGDVVTGRLLDLPILKNTQPLLAKNQRPVRPPYAGFEDLSSQDYINRPGSSSGVRYMIDHGQENPAIRSSHASEGRVSQSVRVVFDGGNRQRSAAPSGSTPTAYNNQNFQSDGNNRDIHPQNVARGAAAVIVDANRGSGMSDDVFATFNPLREISQPARIQFLYRDETFPKSNRNSNNNHMNDPSSSLEADAFVPHSRQSFNRSVVNHQTSASIRNRVDDRIYHRPTHPPIPFIERTSTTRDDRRRESNSLRNDFREVVRTLSSPISSTTSSFAPANRYSSSRFVTPATQWFPPAPQPTLAPSIRTTVRDQDRESMLLRELRDERETAARVPPSTTFSLPTARPRHRDVEDRHSVSYSFPDEELRSTSRSPPPPVTRPQIQLTAPRITHPDHDHDRRRQQQQPLNPNNHNKDERTSDGSRPQFSQPLRDQAASNNPGDGRQRVNYRVIDHVEHADVSLDYRDPFPGEGVAPDSDPVRAVEEDSEIVNEERKPEPRPHQPPPPPPDTPDDDAPKTRLSSRFEFPSHRELPAPRPTLPPVDSVQPAHDSDSSTGRTRQGRRIRPPKQSEADHGDNGDRLPEQPERPERPAKPQVIVRDLNPPSAVTATPDVPKSSISFVRGAPIDHGTPLGLQDYPVEDLRGDSPDQPKSIADPEDDVPRETRPPPPPPTRKRSRTSRRKNKNKKKERIQQRLPHNYNRLPSRPANLYETPIPLETASKCDTSVCVLPDCNCGHSKIPGNLKAKEIPQIVMLTFDDAINDLNWELYQEIFHSGRKNPNGCPPLGTFYVSHEWTDYGQVQTLYSMGHEMASHGVTHSFGEKFSKRQWMKEINGQRQVLHMFGGVKLEDVRGMRAPFLQVGGNKMFEMLYEANFTYDSSMPVFENRPPFYPYTLDYALNHECMITPCPTKSFPGLWEVGMVMWEDLNGGRCSMGDACSNPTDEDGVHQMLLKNFNRHYESNRAPFGIYYHSAWFSNAAHRKGFMRFMDEVMQKSDVFFTTKWQMIQWMRDPTPMHRIANFEPWRCDVDRDLPDACTSPVVCNVKHEGQGHRFMKTCQPCPDIYPWVGNTGFGDTAAD